MTNFYKGDFNPMDHDSTIVYVAKLEAEVERLQGALKTLRHANISGHVNYEPLHAFIDRALEGRK